MATGVITVGGKKYAVDLYWQVSELLNAPAKAAKMAATQSGSKADFFCVRSGSTQGRVPQFGLGEKALGHEWNMPTAAASLANHQPGSWAGVFSVPEGVWFIEVRDDLIAPDGDHLFADEAEAMSRLQETSAMGGLERIYAPPSWAIPGAESTSLTSLLSGRSDCRLRPVKLPPKLVYGLAGVAATLVLGTFLTLYLIQRSEDAALEAELLQQQQQQELQKKDQEERKRREEELRRQKEEEQTREQMKQRVLQMPTYQRVWEMQPKVLAWLKACQKTFDKVEVAPLGWSLTSASCSGRQVLASWTRTTGPADVPSGAEIDVSMRTATASFPLETLPVRGAEPLWPSQGVVLYALHNDWQADLSPLPDDALPPLPNGQQVPPPPWQKRKVSWKVPLAPWNLQGPLVDLPGLMLDTLSWQQDGSWQMEGVLYEQRR